MCKWKRIMGLMTAIVLLWTMMSLPVAGEKAQAVTDDIISSAASSTAISYQEYLTNILYQNSPTQPVEITTAHWKESEDSSILENYVGVEKSIKIPLGSAAVWEFELSEAAMYSIDVVYTVLPGRLNNAQIRVTVDGVLPYKEMDGIILSRTIQDVLVDEEFPVDNYGNQTYPDQETLQVWKRAGLTDAVGYYAHPLTISLSEGKHTIAIETQKEDIAIEKIILYAYEELPTYAQIKEEYKKNGYQEATSSLEIQAEKYAMKSTFTIQPAQDKVSPATYPQSAAYTRLNMVSTGSAGESLTWKVYIEKAGLYKIAMRYRQDESDSHSTYRRLYIDSEVPFAEAESLEFQFKKQWQVGYLGSEEEDYLFYLTPGEHEFTLETVLGQMADIANELQDILLSLNSIYREILVITGPQPDTYRDYNFKQYIPETIENLKTQADRLHVILAQMREMTSAEGQNTSIINILVTQLEQMYEKPSIIAKNYSSFKDNISALSTVVQALLGQPLDLDYLVISGSDYNLQKADDNFFGYLAYQVQMFYYSFVQDYDSLQDSPDADKPRITVWTASGRDQANIIRKMIYTKYYGTDSEYIPELELVSGDALMPAILAGVGPDVALGYGNGDPVNYGLRNAVMDLSGFDDLEEVKERFFESALVAYTINGKLYGLPETQSFSMMFYRTDIMEELHLEIPETWDDVIAILPVLMQNNMTFGLLPSTTSVSLTGFSLGASSGTGGLLMLMAQRNIPLYTNNGLQTTLDTDESIDCFTTLCNMFTLYKLPLQYDFVTRFRTGEVPIGIADYSTYNQLMAFAPEINGLWKFAHVPGTMDENGKINYSVVTSGAANMIVADTKYPEYAWDYLKWWSEAETQLQYAQGVESILGTAGRQSVSNKEALAGLSWDKESLDTIMDQWENAVGLPEVPGGYIVSRNIDFAFKSVYDTNANPGDTMTTYIESINKELYRKQKEFGMVE